MNACCLKILAMLFQMQQSLCIDIGCAASSPLSDPSRNPRTRKARCHRALVIQTELKSQSNAPQMTNTTWAKRFVWSLQGRYLAPKIPHSSHNVVLLHIKSINRARIPKKLACFLLKEVPTSAKTEAYLFVAVGLSWTHQGTDPRNQTVLVSQDDTTREIYPF